MEAGNQSPPPSNDILELKKLGGPVFVIWGEISQGLFEKAKSFTERNKRITKLNLLIESGGGDPDVAFNTANVLRSCCNNMTAYVPRWAKSAATLICLGANDIVLSFGAQLGPLDTQVVDPRISELERGVYISALSAFKALNAIADFLKLDLVITIKSFGSIPLALEFIKVLSRPILEQLDVFDIGILRSALDMSERYGVELLQRSGVVVKEAIEIAGILVNDYPSHSFVIDLEEARKIGLRARPPSADENNALKQLYEFLSNTIGPLGEKCYYGAITESRG